MSKVFVTGDIHGYLDIRKLNSKNFPKGRSLTKEDYVIICGDFGLVFWETPTPEEEYWLEWLNNKKWTTLFIDGNHDNIKRIRNIYPTCKFLGAKCHQIKKSIYHIERGEILIINNKKIWCMGGAVSVDKQDRTENVDWWAEEKPSAFDRVIGLNNLNINSWTVDYIITHSLPTDVVLKCFPEYKSDDFTDYLSTVSEMTTFQKWYTGHYHIDSNIYDKKIYISLYNSILPLGEDFFTKKGDI